MSVQLFNYFTEFPDAIKKASNKSVAKQLEVLQPIVKDSSTLFYRAKKRIKRDKLVYVFLDGSAKHRAVNYTEDWKNCLPVAYIGMGTLTRPLNHGDRDLDKVNFRFREWLEFMKRSNKPVYVAIYSMHMTDEEAKALEADLINLTIYKQSPLNGLPVYKNALRPITLFNSKHETSNQIVYSVHGVKHKKFFT